MRSGHCAGVLVPAVTVGQEAVGGDEIVLPGAVRGVWRGPLAVFPLVVLVGLDDALCVPGQLDVGAPRGADSQERHDGDARPPALPRCPATIAPGRGPTAPSVRDGIYWRKVVPPGLVAACSIHHTHGIGRIKRREVVLSIEIESFPLLALR